MNRVKQYIDQLARLRSQIPSQVEDILERSKENILDLIREDQLFNKGIDGTGKDLLSYRPYTVAIKKFQGKKFTNTTLNDTGAFYRGFDLLFTGVSVGIFSRDAKTPELIEKYGPDIFTLTIDNNKVLNEEIILPQLIEWLLSQIKI